MALTSSQQALLLFKKWLGKSSTNTSWDFYEEPYNIRSAILATQVWQDSASIAGTAPVLAPGADDGTVQYFEDEPLTLVPGTTNAFYSANLVDAVPFNFGDGVSYNYAVKDSLGNPIYFGQGEWIVDCDAGILTFYGTLPANMPPTITFYKYIGAKGVASGGTTSPLTTKGDVWVYGPGDTRLPVGADKEVLIADSSQAKGVRWGPVGNLIIKQVEVDFGAVPTFESTFTITDADILSTHFMMGSIAWVATADNDLSEIEVEVFDCIFAPANGSFDVRISSLEGRVTGKFMLNYSYG